MGGEAGIEGGVPPTIDQKSVPPNPPKELSKELSKDKSIKSKEQKKKEKEQRAFDNKVAILADKLWLADVLRKGKDSHSYYRDLARKILIEKAEVNARRRKAREDKKKREEPAPRPDIPNAPPDQGGEGTSGTEEIARSEATTQEPTVEQTPPEQQEELAREDSYLEWVRDELSKYDEKGKDKEETRHPVDNEGLFKKVIESTAKRLGIDPNNLPPALVEKMRKDFLARKAKGRGGEALGGGGDSH